jgi:SOS regulatory protein LexA
MSRRTDIPDKVSRLRSFYLTERRTPGYNEMLSIFEYRSKNAVHGLLRRLQALGYLRIANGKMAFTAKLTGAIRVLGSVQAGFPSPAEEELLDTLSLDEFLVERPDSTFMLKVSGDSMVDAGIQPGDLVLVERGRAPKSNDIVIAEVDGEWTMKYYIKDKRGVRLEPANKAFKTIRAKQTLRIGGVVRSVVRKYGRH